MAWLCPWIKAPLNLQKKFLLALGMIKTDPKLAKMQRIRVFSPKGIIYATPFFHCGRQGRKCESHSWLMVTRKWCLLNAAGEVTHRSSHQL